LTTKAKSPRRSEPPHEAAQVAVRTIKKYPNRRLYDTHTSSYITLHEVKNMVVAGTALQVVDAKNNEDLTRSIFLQIILEEESGGVPMFSEAALANIIRFYGHSMQGFMGSYLEKNVQAFLDIQQHMSEQSKQLTPELWTQMMSQPNPFLKNVMGNYTEQSQQMLKQMQDQMFQAMGLKR
jgi:polyhydroxyalkanoate synthesis repressor PhaR